MSNSQLSFPHDDKTNCLPSGPILTQIFRDGEAQGLFSAESISKETLMKRMGHPDEVANVLCFLLSDEASYVTGGKFGSIRLGSINRD